MTSAVKKKKRKEIEISLDKVKEEKWYAVKEPKDKGKEHEKAEKSLADIKAELVEERERRKIAEKLEKEQRMKRANEKKEVHLLKEKLKEKKLVKEHSNKVSDEDCFEDECTSFNQSCHIGEAQRLAADGGRHSCGEYSGSRDSLLPADPEEVHQH